MTTVFVAGTFDFLHPGHLHFFAQARTHGGRLVVLVARDETVAYIKGKKPIHNEQRRLAAVQRCDLVDEAFLGSLTDVFSFLDRVPVDVICLGYDQRAFTDRLDDELKRRNLSPKVVRLRPFDPQRWKSSKMKP